MISVKCMVMSRKTQKNVWEVTSQLITVAILEGSAWGWELTED